MSITETTINTTRGNFVARTAGADTNPLVLCLHGFPDYPATFDTLASELAAADYRVVSPYMRGHAPSPVEGSLAMGELAADLLALIDALSPNAPVFLVAHDYGAQIAYEAISTHAERFKAAVTLAVAHPAIMGQALRKSPRELWTLRHIGLFQLKGFGEKYAARNNFAYIDKLWRRWAPDYQVPAEYLESVKKVFRNSWPNPIAMYRAGGFNTPDNPVSVPLLFIAGENDGASSPRTSEGQERIFTGDYKRIVLPQVGHFPHLENPQAVNQEILAWFSAKN